MTASAVYFGTGACLGEAFGLDLEPWHPGRDMTRPHWHRACEINFVYRGSGKYLIAGRAFPIEPQTVFVIPGGIPHQTVANPASPHWNFTVYFQPDTVAPLGDPAIELAHATASSVKQLHAAAFADLWQNVIDGLDRERRHTDQGHSLAAASHILQTCILVQRAVAGHGLHPVDTPVPVRVAYVRRMMDFIAANPGRATLTTVARHVALHPGYASTLFHAVTGQTMSAYIAATRLHSAHWLLEQTNLPIAEVARRSGFASVSTFYRRFRAYYGTHPGAVRPCTITPPAAAVLTRNGNSENPS